MPSPLQLRAGQRQIFAKAPSCHLVRGVLPTVIRAAKSV